MHTVIAPERVELPPGTVVRMLGSWQDYQILSKQLGDPALRAALRYRTSPRIKYRPG